MQVLYEWRRARSRQKNFVLCTDDIRRRNLVSIQFSSYLAKLSFSLPTLCIRTVSASLCCNNGTLQCASLWAQWTKTICSSQVMYANWCRKHCRKFQKSSKMKFISTKSQFRCFAFAHCQYMNKLKRIPGGGKGCSTEVHMRRYTTKQIDGNWAFANLSTL